MTFKSLDHDGGERAEAVEHLHEDEGPGHVPEVRRVDLITHTHTHTCICKKFADLLYDNNVSIVCNQ